MMSGRILPTCKRQRCPQWSLFDGNEDTTKCPNYIINNFVAQDTGQTYPVEDCAPLRTNMLYLQMSNDVLELKKMFVEMRNSFSSAEKVAQHLVSDIANKNIEAIAITRQPEQHTITATIVPQIN